MALWYTINPVSYTHLDVYKRQDKIDTTLTVSNNVCHLDKGNSLTYDFIDGEKELSFGKSTIYTCLLYTSRCV